MHVDRDWGGKYSNTTNFQLLANDAGHFSHCIACGTTVSEFDCLGTLSVSDLSIKHSLRNGIRQGEEIFVFSNKVCLAKQFNESVADIGYESV